MKRRGITVFTLLLFAAITALLGTVSTIWALPEPERTAPGTSQSTEVLAPLENEEKPIEYESLFAGFSLPVKGEISSPYGYRRDPFTGKENLHRGVDIAVPTGTPVLAACDGTVIHSDFDPIGGNYVILSHRNGTQSYYGHLQTRTVARGDSVRKGESVGLSGATGTVTGAHLHFQISYQGKTVDPLRYLPDVK